MIFSMYARLSCTRCGATKYFQYHDNASTIRAAEEAGWSVVGMRCAACCKWTAERAPHDGGDDAGS